MSWSSKVILFSYPHFLINQIGHTQSLAPIKKEGEWEGWGSDSAGIRQRKGPRRGCNHSCQWRPSGLPRPSTGLLFFSAWFYSCKHHHCLFLKRETREEEKKSGCRRAVVDFGVKEIMGSGDLIGSVSERGNDPSQTPQPSEISEPHSSVVDFSHDSSCYFNLYRCPRLLKFSIFYFILIRALIQRGWAEFASNSGPTKINKPEPEPNQ